jgi:hypothetical protein
MSPPNVAGLLAVAHSIRDAPQPEEGIGGAEEDEDGIERGRGGHAHGRCNDNATTLSLASMRKAVASANIVTRSDV